MQGPKNQSPNANFNNKRSKVQFSSKHIKGKKKHARTKTELVGMNKQQRDQPHNFDYTDSSPFGPKVNNKRGGRRNNLSIEKTFDFFGFGTSSQQNNNLNFNSTKPDLSGLFRTMNNGVRGPKKNFTSAAEAMGCENGGGLQRSSSIFSRSFGFSSSFHNKHNSVNLEKKENNHFETEIDNRVDSLENGKLPEQ